MKIKHIDYGVASRIGDTIYIHKKIKNYPKLHKAILNHEKEHTSGFAIKDILIDLTGKHLKDVKKEYWRFVFNNPSSWIQFLPFAFYEGNLVWDISIGIIWIWFILLFLILLQIQWF